MRRIDIVSNGSRLHTMDITSTRTEQRLTLALCGRLDATSAPALEAALQLEGIRELVMDLQACDYISSAGLRGVLKAIKETAKVNASMVLVGAQPHVMSVLEVTGLTRLVTVKPKAREISIEGLEFISAGMCGQCFRMDRETIVKLQQRRRRIAREEGSKLGDGGGLERRRRRRSRSRRRRE